MSAEPLSDRNASPPPVHAYIKGAPTAPIQDDRLFIEQIVSTIWSRKWLILLIVISGLAPTYWYVNQLAPRYSAKAMLVIDVRPTDVINITSVLSGLPANRDIAETEVDVMRSPELAKRVIDTLKLSADPEFAPWLAPKKERLFDRITTPSAWPIWSWPVWSWIPKEEDAVEPVKSRPLDAADTAIISNFLEHLSITISDRSYTIVVTFDSFDAEKAAVIVNTVTDEYLASQVEAKFEAAARASVWLVQQVDSLREKVRHSQELVERYREKHGLIQASGQTITTQQLSQLNSELVIAQTDLATKEARIRNLRALARAGRADSAPEAIESPIIQRLRERETDLLRREGELAATYGDRHPLIINIRTERRDLNDKIDLELNRIVVGLENEVAVARQRQATLQDKIAKLEAQVGEAGLAEVKLKELQREADANQQLFDSFLARYKESSAQGEFQNPDARILSRARAPLSPSFPNKSGILTLSAFGFFCCGVLLAFVRERFESGFRSGNELTDILGVPLLGVMPNVPRLRKNQAAHEYLLSKPTSAFSESCRSVWAALTLQSEKPLQCLLVTSSVPDEGKTSFALSLACGLGRLGHKVVVVDADFRRPSIAALTRISGSKSLMDMLLGRATVDEIIVESEELGISVITATETKVDPLKLLNSTKFTHLIERLRSRFDIVIIDSAPVMPAADALMLSRMVDAVVFLVRWRRTPRAVALNASAQVLRAGVSTYGGVLTRVDTRRYGLGGAADAGYYYGYGRKYYQN